MRSASFVAMAVLAFGPAAPGPGGDQPAVATDVLVIEYHADAEQRAPRLLDEIRPETLLTVRARGFDDDTTGTVRQCVSGERRSCRNELEVRFDDRGAATFQYLVTDDVGAAAGPDEACRLGGARCSLELAVGDKVVAVETVFVDAAPPPGRIAVEPREGLAIGDTVTVTASGFPPGAEMTVVVCASPARSGTARCGAPGPAVTVPLDSSGRAELALTLDVSEVGSERVACGRRTPCRVVVISDDIGVRAPAMNLSFADTPGAGYSTARLAIGIAAAVALAAMAAWLTRSTDWSPPLDSDSSPIEDAEFADLDHEAAVFEAAEQLRRDAAREATTQADAGSPEASPEIAT